MSSSSLATKLLLLLLLRTGAAFSFSPIGKGATRFQGTTKLFTANIGSSSEEVSTGTPDKKAMSAGASDPDAFRELAFRISWCFEPREFKPVPLLANCHFQTISGVFLRADPNCRYMAPDDKDVIQKGLQLVSSVTGEPDIHGESFWDERQRILTPDGDFFHVDYKYHARGEDEDEAAPKGLVVVVHGLQSNSNSSLSVDLGRAYLNQGFDVACINFRGCSGVPNDNLKAYHLGFTDDLIQYLSIMNNGPEKPLPIFISGFSLGANVVLKALGEMGERAFGEFSVYGAAVTGAPFDNERNINCVQKAGFNKLAYNNNLLESMKKTYLSQLARFPDSKEAMVLDYNEIAEATEISAFENAAIAPLFGFKDNIDYYRKTNCINFLDDIQVPTLIMNAADDPFFDPDFFPTEFCCHSAEGRSKRSPISMVRTQHGGHLGYMFHQKDGNESDMEDVSFMPAELARFVKHVFDRRAYLERDEIAWE